MTYDRLKQTLGITADKPSSPASSAPPPATDPAPPPSTEGVALNTGFIQSTPRPIMKRVADAIGIKTRDTRADRLAASTATLRQKLKSGGHSISHLAYYSGIDAVAFNRLDRGEAVPAETLRAMTPWLVGSGMSLSLRTGELVADPSATASMSAKPKETKAPPRLPVNAAVNQPPVAKPTPTQAEAAALINALGSVTQPISVKAIRDCLRNALTWPDAPPSYKSDRITQIMTVLFDRHVIFDVADPRGGAQMVRIERDASGIKGLEWVARFAKPNGASEAEDTADV